MILRILILFIVAISLVYVGFSLFSPKPKQERSQRINESLSLLGKIWSIAFTAAIAYLFVALSIFSLIIYMIIGSFHLH